jgi:hypothetical protein
VARIPHDPGVKHKSKISSRLLQDTSPTWRYDVHLSKGHGNKIICVCGTLVYLIVSPYSERDR